MYQKNRLKDLIYIQENKPCNEQTIKGLFRSIVEPVLESNVESLVLLRLNKKSKNNFSSLLKRLEFSQADVYDFSDNPINENIKNILKEKIWDKTEFVYVFAERFGAVLVYDYEESEVEGFAHFYIFHNSKKLSESFDIINANSKLNLTKYQEKWHPDRRDNINLNLSIRKIVENLNETNQEILISKLENEVLDDAEDVKSRLDFLLAKSSYIAHEMRNLLSICNLYSEIIEKQTAKVKFEDKNSEKSIMNARECIRKSLKMCGNLLLELKSVKSDMLAVKDLKELTEKAIELTSVYKGKKQIKFENKIKETAEILVDENKFLAVLINLIKNAVESIEEKGKIIVEASLDEEKVNLVISNTGTPISKELQDKIFAEGFTTKQAGSGLGLIICKNNLEEQFANLKLKKSDEKSTDFEITLLRGNLEE